MWAIISQDGPRSPASTSQIKSFSIWGLKYFIQASLMFAILNSSCSKGTYSGAQFSYIFAVFQKHPNSCAVQQSLQKLRSPLLLSCLFSLPFALPHTSATLPSWQELLQQITRAWVYGSNLAGRPGRWFGSGRARPSEEFKFTFKVK